MKIYLVRHGEAEHNVGNYYANGTKSDLTAKGKKQAKAVAKRLAKIPVDVIVCSKYDRAAQTAAEILKARTKCKIVRTPLANEMFYPSKFVGLPDDIDMIKKGNEEIRKHRFERGWHYDDEENWYEFAERVYKLIEYLEGLKEENIVVITHGLVIKLLCAELLLLKNHHYKEWVKEYGEEIFYRMISHAMGVLTTTNTGITVLETEDEGRWRIRTINDFSHL